MQFRFSAQNLNRKSLFLFAVKFDLQMKEMGGAQSSSARHFAFICFRPGAPVDGLADVEPIF